MCSPTLTFSHLFSVTFWNPCPPSQCLPISGSLSSELSPSTTTSLPLTLSPFVFSFSVQFSHSVLSDSLQPHGLQHDRLPCPSTPGACSNSCPSSWWCHPTILCSVIPFSFHLKSFPASGSFQMSQFFTSRAQSTRVSALASVLPMNIQDWSPLGGTGWISLQSKGLSESSPTPQFKSINSSMLRFLYSPTLTSIQDYWKNQSFD